MPFQVTKGAPDHSGALSTPTLEITLWPHQSLTPKGFVAFIGATSMLFALPLLSVVGTAALWFLLPFIAATVTLVWCLLKRSWKDGTLREQLTLTPELISILRINPRAPKQSWEANPFWVRAELHSEPVENYLTLRGGARDVELGRFLTPEERAELHMLLLDALARTKTAQ